MRLLLALLLVTNIVYANSKLETVKTSCILQSEYSGKTLEQQKEVLINQAKRDALEELYGSLIVSKTNVENGKLISDKIKQKAIGAIRVKGNPKFYNGENFGEICSDIKAYITEKDLEKYSQKQVSLKNFCFNDTTVATKDIKYKAKEKAYREILTKYKPSLRNISLEEAQELIHKFNISKDKFDFNTGSYCFDAIGSVYPYELELYKAKPTSHKKKKEEVVREVPRVVETKSNTLKKITFANDYLEGQVSYKIVGDEAHVDIFIDNIYRSLKGGVSVSFPQFTNSRRILDTSSNKASTLKVYKKGSKLWNAKLKKVIRSSYLLIEGWQTSWRKHNMQSISLVIDMYKMDELVLNVRAVLVNGKKQLLLPAYGREDQQDFPVKQIIIKR
ncbi:hypothetical protein [Poseidonibacter ostreae]|jgi:hypothetical protein|uniref:DUF2092 domain-containing protein n=1 Tax=Poseidonibacter ostreae TaxID=2654171 RepID=A0A6L4WRK0_9BACT|nr:hypothetical protein [Poseidonibacter ostreae]KAB7883095.1 hypothetical protein GA417_13110 [Poseidonibacter ostreae]KAB7888196.1 hypothetical protein GBG19_09555 [Poseidonibacter ostreae]KAB7892028.1 hypothetical protein GBG18_04540 [Poseidonibacter ostreae]